MSATAGPFQASAVNKTAVDKTLAPTVKVSTHSLSFDLRGHHDSLLVREDGSTVRERGHKEVGQSGVSERKEKSGDGRSGPNDGRSEFRSVQQRRRPIGKITRTLDPIVALTEFVSDKAGQERRQGTRRIGSTASDVG